MTANATSAPQIYPVLRYKDAHEAMRFLEKAFGFTTQEVNEGTDGLIDHAQLAYDGGLVMIGSRRPEPSPFDTGTTVLYVAVDDPDAHHAQAVGAGAEIMMELVDQPYGSREYAARDPEGNVWSFGTYRPRAVT